MREINFTLQDLITHLSSTDNIPSSAKIIIDLIYSFKDARTLDKNPMFRFVEVKSYDIPASIQNMPIEIGCVSFLK